jgi:hypothetical protein
MDIADGRIHQAEEERKMPEKIPDRFLQARSAIDAQANV